MTLHHGPPGIDTGRPRSRTGQQCHGPSPKRDRPPQPNPTEVPLPRRAVSNYGPVSRPAMGSREVSWWAVHEHVAGLLTTVGSWPMVGTPAWCQLADDDPAKLAALLDAARHWALRIESCQQPLTDASHEVSAAANWSELAATMHRRDGAYIRRNIA
jgi:hypothetical protein